jgi:hypothetical protein
MMRNSGDCKKLSAGFKDFCKHIKNMFRQAAWKILKRGRQRQISVACPNKIRKRIWSNLCATARCKINPHRTKIALEIIAAVKKGRDLANFQPKSNRVAKTTSRIKRSKPVLKVSKISSRAKDFAPSMLGKIKVGFASIRQQFSFGFGINHSNQPVAS